MEYEGAVFRPPSEANSLILQVTIGCSYNKCAFCGMYQEKHFRVRAIDDVRREIEWARREVGALHKVFLADGDALIARPAFLHLVLDALHAAFPDLTRVSCYASPQNLLVRSVEDMASLREAGLSQYYLGIESGHDEVLKRLEKGVTAAEMIQAGLRAHQAGVRLSTMILLNAGNRDLSLEHATESARVVNAIQPRFVSTLVLTPVPGTPLWEQARSGAFEELSPLELAQELRAFLAGLELSGTVFRSNHASNYLSVAGTLPKDKERMLSQLDWVLAHPDQARFRPEWLRGL
ncbi:MAG: B12-binding domain-containing radical SAM protein [Planctomycetes bacterium]|nr:B12-binding domain-containing radical SAM protein [Planctomycetota bacterium]